MIARYLRTSLLAGILLLSHYVHAAHIIGGELSYEYLAGNNYQVTLEIYRDCAGGGALFDDPAWLFVYSASSGALEQTISLALPGFTNVSPDLSDPCLISPPIICVERAVYSEVISLPPLSGGYNLVYQRCCRNNTIVNLFDPGETGSTYQAFVPSISTMTNSSPKFNDLPPLAICRDVELVFDHSATDPDGDQLVYSLCAPFEGASSGCPMPAGPLTAAGCPPNPGPPPYANVIFGPAYSAAYPLDASPALAIDPVTGLLTGTPTLEGQFVVGICVEERRGGVLIDRHYRDFQFNVTNCDLSIIAATTDVIIDCEDLTVTFDNFSSGATSYFWDFGVGGATSTLATPTFTFPDTGTYYVTLVAEPGVSCTDTTVAVISLFPVMQADFEMTAACPDQFSDFTDLSLNTYGILNNWFWDFGDGNFSTDPSPGYAYDDGGNYSVWLYISNDIGCADSLNQVISIPFAPELNASADNTCLDQVSIFTDSSSITGSSISSWDWDFGDGGTGSGSPSNHTYDTPGSYTVSLEVTAANGCRSDTSFAVEVPALVQALVSSGDTICEGDSYQLVAGGGDFYIWSPASSLSGATSPDPTASPTVTTTYQVIVSDECSSDSANVTVYVLPAPTTNAEPDTSIIAGQTVQIYSSGGVSYNWFPTDSMSDPNIPDPLVNPAVPTMYYVEVTGANGCSRLDSVFIFVEPRCQGFAFPNAFTPDGNGLNDVFLPVRISDDVFSSLQIYDRWGTILFRSFNEFTGWDGTYKGVAQELNTYVWMLQATCDGILKTQSGTVTLLR